MKASAIMRRLVAGLGLVGVATSACAPVYLPRGGSAAHGPLRNPAAGADLRTVALRLSVPAWARDTIRQTTEETALFRSVSVDPSSTVAADVVVDLSLWTRPDPGGLGRVLYLIFGAALTLGVLPIVNPTDVILEASVTGRNGEALGRYTAQGSVLEVHQVLTVFLPLGLWLSPSSAAERVVAALTRELWERIAECERMTCPAPREAVAR